MPREIRFRCWNKESKAFVSDSAVKSNLFNYFDMDSMVVMQFTGLKDKNGKDVFQSDLIQHIADGNFPHLVYEIVWWEEKLAWAVKDKFGGYAMLWPEKDFKVVGDVYSNPELLT